MAGLRTFMVGLIVVIFATYLIISGSLSFVGIKNPSSPLITDYGLNGTMTSMNAQINDFSSKTSIAKDQLNGDKPSTTDYLFLIFAGAFYIPQLFLNLFVGGISSIKDLVFSSFGGAEASPGIILGITLLGAVLLITAVLWIIRAIRTGDSG